MPNRPPPTLAGRRPRLRNDVRAVSRYLLALLKWTATGMAVGLLGGAVGGIFHLLIGLASDFRSAHIWIIGLLPLGGAIIALAYSAVKAPLSTDRVISAVRTGERIHPLMAPLIFISTVLTQLLGGSAGREGAAIQLGGCLGCQLGQILRLDGPDRRVVILCGISAVFSAVFGTPLAAAVFAMEVICIGQFCYTALVPCLAAAYTGRAVSALMGVETEQFAAFFVPDMSLGTVGCVVLLGVLVAGISVVFCIALHRAERGAARLLPRPVVRAVVGGAVLVGLTALSGTTAYNGAGMNLVHDAVAGQADSFGWLLKLCLTVLTLSAGFRGGEVVPSLAIGATFGCVFGQLLGPDPGFCAAVGAVAMFCGMVNCPVSSILIGLELFGAEAVPYFAMACGVSYLVSGKFGLYGSQKLLFSKLKAEYIDICIGE